MVPTRFVLFLLVFPHKHNGAYAQLSTQPAPPLPPLDMWDFSSVAIIIGSLIGTFLLLAVLSWSLCCRCSESRQAPLRNTEWLCSCSPGNIPSELLRTFPILSYSSIKHLRTTTQQEEPLQCAICLSDFSSQDALRLLPHCNHVFHPPCIDAWLSSHVTCPVCRANLVDSCHVTVSIEEASRSREDGNWSKRKLLRFNSTGHSVVEEGACVERYTLRLPEDVRRCIMMQRSASCNVVGTSRKGLCWSDSEGSSRGKQKSLS
ncbi:hypothetical protein RJT34_25037 [Clitoria ternatea]|uniref:RING-type E3 ubiquitin transferase n=1 Tax=Clitoria ternatea TaxID=43366 RepID=A0AAN9FVD6_CLITE